MEVLKSNPVLNFNENQLQNVRKALGYEGLNKLKQDIELLKEWILKQNHFEIKIFDSGYLERLLIYNKGSIERAKQKLDRLCTCTKLMPEFLQNFDIKNEFRYKLNVSNTCFLPQPTEDNYRVVITEPNGKDDDGYLLIQYCRYLVVLVHYLMNNDYCQGCEWILDTRKFTISNVLKLNPIVVQKAVTLIVEAMGLRLKKIHIISGSKFFDAILAIIKQALSAKLKERLIIHSDVKSLHTHYSKQHVPKDYGGDERTIKELNDQLFKEISSDKNIELVKFMETAVTDESNRLTLKFNEEFLGMPGSFRKLCLD